MALAAHAADSGGGEKKEENTNTKRSAGHADGDSYYHYLGQRSPPRSTSAATALTGNRGHNAFHGMSLSRPSDPAQSMDGGGGANKNEAAGTATATTAPCAKTAAAATGVPEADGHQDDGAATSSAEEERKAAKIRAQMSVLMVGFFEIIRQVSEYVLGSHGWPD